MYKSVLLTESEINLLRKVLNGYLDKNLVSIDYEDLKNLHRINRTLLGVNPTKSINQ